MSEFLVYVADSKNRKAAGINVERTNKVMGGRWRGPPDWNEVKPGEEPDRPHRLMIMEEKKNAPDGI